MNNDNAITGVVLIGGQSSRMGTSKFLLKYHHTTQLLHSVKLLGNFCTDIYISCNKNQVSEIPSHLKIIVDDEKYADAGPMTGVLSAFEAKQNSVFVLGCDYPFITSADLQLLSDAFADNKISTVFANVNDVKPEPLIGIYDFSNFEKMKDCYLKNERSLRSFLIENNAQIIYSSNINSLKSVDTVEEFKAALLSIKTGEEL